MEGVSYKRDENYYFTDGNIVIAAEAVLFKVHKVMLARDESMFHNMFSLPNAEHDETSDESPLVLQDEPENIRSLLWILYALPKIVASAASDITRENIDRLIRCLEMANKYHFGSIETWALETLRAAFLDSEMKQIHEDDDAHDVHDTAQCGFTFGMLVRVTKMTNQVVSKQASSLTGILFSKWKLLFEDVIALDKLAGALHIIEASDLRLPRGLAYHNILVNQVLWRNSPLLNREQKVNLLAGYHKLQEKKLNAERLEKLPHYRHSSACEQTVTCLGSWNAFTKMVCSLPGVLDGYYPARQSSQSGCVDYITKLKIISEAESYLAELTINAELKEMPDDCRVNAFQNVNMMLAIAEFSLSDIFTF